MVRSAGWGVQSLLFCFSLHGEALELVHSDPWMNGAAVHTAYRCSVRRTARGAQMEWG